MTKNRSETQNARYIQNVYDVPYQTALRVVREVLQEAREFARVTNTPVLDAIERLARRRLS